MNLEVTTLQLRRKNSTIALIVIIATMLFMIQPAQIAAQSFDTKAESAIIVDADSGTVLYAKNENEALPPASMTKMMTEYLVLEKINNGELKWEDTTQISDFVFDISANNNFSGIGLRKNIDYTVRELYEAMAINSDNATSIALAEMVSGSEGEFVKLMNQKGEELGLTDFKFVNSTGLDNKSLNGLHPEGTSADDTNLMSARSAALLAYHLINDFPEALEISKIPKTVFDETEIVNWNWMLPHDAQYLKEFHYEGVDGLKTGHTELAGYTFTSTAERDGKRLITVVMKTKSIEQRFRETAKLLDYGFSQFEKVELFPKGYAEEEFSLPVEKGKEENVSLQLTAAIKLPILKGTEEEYSVEYTFDSDKMNEDGQLVAPIEKGEKVGEAVLTYKGEPYHPYITNEDKKVKVDIITSEEVKKKNFFLIAMDGIGNFFSNIVSKIKNLF